MATFAGGFGVPGAGSILQTSENEFLWGGDSNKTALRKSAVIRGETRDAGSSPTTTLRPGLILGLETATNEYSEWDADAAQDGSENVAGILGVELKATDFDANDADRVAPIFVAGPVKAKALSIQGSNLVGHVDEFLARRQMAKNFIFDDDPMGYLAGGITKNGGIVTGTADTLTDSQTGSVLYYSSASAVIVTLPTVQPGLEYMIVRTGAAEILIQGSANIITGELADASVASVVIEDDVVFTTANEHLGAYAHVLGVYYGTSAKWFIRTNEALTRAFNT